MPNQAFISFRLGVPLWMPEARFGEVLDLLDAHRGVTDEVTLFTSETHPPLPLEVLAERAVLLAARLAQARERGYRAGINILATIGHHEENLPHSLQGDYTPMTDLDGRICRGSFCPNDERLLEYVRQAYRLMAEAGPDYLWIDDDVRLYGHGPIRAGCFCDRCLGLFATETGQSYTRPALQQALSTGPLADKLALRRAWLEHNRRSLARLFGVIESTIHPMRPGLPLGFMTGERFFEGYDFGAWAQVLAGPDSAEVLWRPGGGFYSDESLMGLVGKAHEIGRQVSLLPPSVVSIQSEVENFPYQRLRKSCRTTALEAAAHIAAGCTGAAFNVLSPFDEPLHEYVPLVAALQAARPFYDLMVRHLGRAQPVGVHTGWCRDLMAAGNADEGPWPGGNVSFLAGGHAAEWFEIGLPPAYAPGGARMTTLCGDGVLALRDEDLQRILAGGVYLDAPALTRLNERGYGDLTGLGVQAVCNEDCLEELVDHPLNEGLAGRRRDGRQSFWKCPAAALVPTNDGAQGVARLLDYGGREVAPVGMGVFENAWGGRVCVAGYYPWMFLQNLAKSAQIKRLARWLSRDRLPAYIASFHKAHLWAREPESGHLALALLNASLDPADDLVLALRTGQGEIQVIDMACGRQTVAASSRDGPYRTFRLPRVGAWEMRLVVTTI